MAASLEERRDASKSVIMIPHHGILGLCWIIRNAEGILADYSWLVETIVRLWIDLPLNPSLPVLE